MRVLLFALALAADTAGTGPQAVTVVVRGLDAGTTVEAERPGTGAITLRDPGLGYVQGTFHGEPARFMQLRLTAVRRQGRREIFDGLVVLSDTRADTVAFAYDVAGVARRVALAPPVRTDVALDPRVTWWVSAGWGALALGYVGFVGVMWALRRR